jgi:hypothetical protein
MSKTCKPHDFVLVDSKDCGNLSYKCSKCETLVSAGEYCWYKRGMEHALEIAEKNNEDKDWISLEEYLGPEALRVDGFDDAIVGIVARCGFDPVLCYDRQKILEVLVERDGMSYEEAVEYYEFNIAGAYMGNGTPMFLDSGEFM